MNEKVSDTLVKDGGHTQDKKNPFSGKLLRGALLTLCRVCCTKVVGATSSEGFLGVKSFPSLLPVVHL